jgi:acylphosphatase
MVGFRFFVVDEARRLGLTGWVRNGADGSTVEVVAEGGEAALRALEAALREGPRHARVDGVEATWSDGVGEFHGFDVVG